MVKNISRKGRVKKHGGASRTFKQKRPYKKFSPNSPRSELSQQDKNILNSIVKNRRSLREKHGAKDTYKAVRRYNKKKTQKDLTSLQKKYHSMRPGPKKSKLKERIAKEEMLLSTTDYGSALEITDDDDFEDFKVPVQHAVAVPVVQGIALPKKLHPMRHLKKRTQTQTEPKPSPRRSQRPLPRGVLETLAAVRARENIQENLKKEKKRTKNAYKDPRAADADVEDYSSGNESDDSWRDNDDDSWTTDDDEVGAVVAPSRTKDSETRPASSTYGSASRKKKRKGKKEVKKKGKKGGKKTRRKS